MSRQGTNTRQRSAQVGVRLTPTELAKVREQAADLGVSAAEVFRRAWLASGGVR